MTLNDTLEALDSAVKAGIASGDMKTVAKLAKLHAKLAKISTDLLKVTAAAHKALAGDLSAED